MNGESRERAFQYEKDTTDRGGRERGLELYEDFLGFKRGELEGLKVLDLGTGETERFSRELKNSGIDATVINLNPDYSMEKTRKTLGRALDRTKISVAATAQELPFKDESFDRALGLYSVTVFADPGPIGGNPEATKLWISEVNRVLKPGGEARFAPIAESDRLYKPYEDFLRQIGLKAEFQRITYGELGMTERTSIDLSGTKHVENINPNESTGNLRLIIKKPEQEVE